MSDPTQQQATAPGTPEHDAAMVAKFVAAGGQAPDQLAPASVQQSTPTPGLPDKFKSVEELAKAYAELEAKLGKKDDPARPEPKAEDGKQPPPTVDVDKLSDEVAENGKLSEESMKALQAKGYSQAEIDAFVAGQVALAEQTVQDLYALAGGEDNFKAVQQWAAASMSEAEKEVYHSALEKDEVSAKLAIQNLVLRYQQENGALPARTISGSRTSTGGAVAPFASIAEQSAAIRDPRYGKDPAYRKQVEARIMASTL
jgi:hypothetical protein